MPSGGDAMRWDFVASDGRSWPGDARLWRVPGSDVAHPETALLDLQFEDARIDSAKLSGRAPGLWRYREALPVSFDREPVTLGEMMTPLIPMDWGGRRPSVKVDSLFPSGSYKDRGAAVLMTHARNIGVGRVLVDSSGNAGAAVAMYAAAAGIKAEVYVPESASAGKIAQAVAAGAEIHRVPGDRAATAAAAMARAEDVYYASHCWNPVFFHGTKTFLFEVMEQRGWRAPEAIVLPAGNGTLLLGCAIGLRDLGRSGLLDRMPRLIGVQSARCAPLVAAFERGEDAAVAVEVTPTIAEGVAIAAPVRGGQMLRAVRDSGGRMVAVSEERVIDTWRRLLARGVCLEPTSALVFAAFEDAEDLGDDTVIALTGHGLKVGGKLAG